MDKKIIFILSIVAGLAVVAGGYYYWKTRMQLSSEVPKSAAQQAAEDLQKTTAGVSAAIGSTVSPNVSTPAVNPVTTNVNPYNNTNPFSGLKTNPFQ